MLRLLIYFLTRLNKLPSGALLLLEILLVLALTAGLHLTFITGMAFSDALALKTTCPPAPTDIPAYECTVQDYIIRMTFGPWAFIGAMIMFFPVLLLTVLGWFVLRFASARLADKIAGGES